MPEYMAEEPREPKYVDDEGSIRARPWQKTVGRESLFRERSGIGVSFYPSIRKEYLEIVGGQTAF